MSLDKIPALNYHKELNAESHTTPTPFQVCRVCKIAKTLTEYSIRRDRLKNNRIGVYRLKKCKQCYYPANRGSKFSRLSQAQIDIVKSPYMSRNLKAELVKCSAITIYKWIRQLGGLDPKDQECYQLAVGA